MNGIELATFYSLAYLAEIIGTISGFGSSVLFVPIAAYFFDMHSVLGITALFHISSNLSKISLFKKGIDWKMVRWLGIPAIIFVGLGAFLTRVVDSEKLELALSVFLIIFSLIFLLMNHSVVKPTRLNAIAGGTISGFLAGLIGTGGAVRGMALAAFGMTKEAFIATSALIDFGVDFSRGVIYTMNGFVHVKDLIYVAVLVVVSFLGTWTGRWILSFMSEDGFRKLVLLVIMSTGLFSIFRILF